MKSLLFSISVLVSFTGALSAKADDIVLDSTNLKSFDAKAVGDKECGDYVYSLVLKDGTTFTTRRYNYGCTTAKTEGANNVILSLNRAKTGRVSMSQNGETVVCFTTIGIFVNGELTFDTQAVRCP